MTTALMPEGRQHYFDNDDNPAAGCLLYTYAAGTSTPKAAFTDSAGLVPHPNPIPLDAKGEAVIFWDGSYKVDLKTPEGVQITGYPVDNINTDPANLWTLAARLLASTGAGLLGFLYGAIYPASSIGRWLQDLANSSGGEFIGFLQAGAGAVLRTVRGRLRDQVCVLDFMTAAQVADVRARTYLLDVAAPVQAAIDFAASIRADLVVPAGGYLLLPATPFADEDGSYVTLAALFIRSHMHIEAEKGAEFKIADNVSSDATPKSMGMFCTNEVLSNVSIRNLTMNMNGANNLMSPLRPTTYNRYNQSQILVSGTPGGVAARIDDCAIDNCEFINNYGACCIVVAQSNSIGVILGKRWKIANSRFYNNGYDCDDHTSIFSWADDVQLTGCEFDNPSGFASSGRTGGNTCYEIHGSNHRISGNKFKNYYRGIWVSSNLTAAEITDSLIIGNEFLTHFYGVDFFRTTATLSQPRNTIIANNTIRFDSYTFAAPVPQQKSAVQVASEYAQADVLVTGNEAFSSDTVVGAVFITITPQGVAGQTHDNIVCRGNKTRGFLAGAIIRTNATNGLGYIAIENNDWIEPIVTPSFTVSFGEFIDPVSAIKTLVLTNNRVIDDRAVPIADYGTYVQGGTIDDLYFSGFFGKGLSAANGYYEAGPLAGRKHGTFENIAFLPVFRSGGVAWTLGDGIRLAYYSIVGKTVTINACWDMGATSVIPVGNFTMDLPIPSGFSSLQYMGTWRIFDDGTNLFYFGTAEVDGTGTQLSFQMDGAQFATETTPIVLAVDDRVSIDIKYRIE